MLDHGLKMKTTLKIVVAIFITCIAATQLLAGTTRKVVKSGELTLVYQSQFLGVPPRGIKVPQATMVQPKNGKLILKKKVSGSGRSKKTLYKFYYKSNKGFKGKDEAKAVVNFFMRKNDGKQIKVPTTNEKIIVRVR